MNKPQLDTIGSETNERDDVNDQREGFRERTLHIVDRTGHVIGTGVEIGGEVVYQGSQVSETGAGKIAKVSRKTSSALGLLLGGFAGSVTGFLGGLRRGYGNKQEKKNAA